MGNQRLLVHLDTRPSNQIDRKMRCRGCSATGDQTWRWAESLSTTSSTCSFHQTRRWWGERKAALVSTSTRQVRPSLLHATASPSLQNSVPSQLRSWVTTWCLLATKGTPFDKRQLVLL